MTWEEARSSEERGLTEEDTKLVEEQGSEEAEETPVCTSTST